MSRSDRRPVGVLALAVLALFGCEVENVAIPSPPAQLALHGVLSPTAATQAILLERTRNGSQDLFGGAVDPLDPITSARGVPEQGATVRLITPSNDTLFGREDITVSGDGRGAGVYRFALSGAALERTGVYKLHARTRAGEVLDAETSVPGGAAAIASVNRTFDRESDTATYSWPAITGARAYFVRVESPFGPRYFFTDSTHVRLPGTLRNTQATGLPRLFFPGFLQTVTISAVDANFYDWYRSHNNSVSGEGLISRVSGGIGVFGSLVRLVYETWDVTAPQTNPVEGTYRFYGTPEEAGATLNIALVIWVESKATRSDQPDAISGQYFKRPQIGAVGCQVCGMIGTMKDGHVELALLRDWYANDTADVFIGDLRGDTLVGSFRQVAGKFLKEQP